MKKITMCIATLSLAVSGFATNPDSLQVTNNQNLKEIIISCEDMIELIMYDVENRRIRKECAYTYILILQDIMSKTEDLDYNINTK